MEVFSQYAASMAEIPKHQEFLVCAYICTFSIKVFTNAGDTKGNALQRIGYCLRQNQAGEVISQKYKMSQHFADKLVCFKQLQSLFINVFLLSCTCPSTMQELYLGFAYLSNYLDSLRRLGCLSSVSSRLLLHRWCWGFSLQITWHLKLR